jgi:hypothetical protein
MAWWIAVDRHDFAVLTSSTNLGIPMRLTDNKLKKLLLTVSISCALLQLAACGGGGSVTANTVDASATVGSTATPGKAKMSLEGNKYNVSLETEAGKLKEIVFHNTLNGDLITSNNLFDIQGSDNKLISSSEFSIDSLVKETDHIKMTMKNDDFVVKIDVNLNANNNYSYIDFSLDSLHGSKQINAFSILPFQAKAPFVYGSINSSPIVSDNFFITPQNPLVNTLVTGSSVTQTIPLKLPLAEGKPISYRTYVGTFSDGQLRRNFNEFLNAARDRPYSPYLHYNSWYDIGYFNPYTEAEALSRIQQFGDELVTKRKVSMDAFLFDDGWDDLKGKWDFSEFFPNGFSKLKIASDQIHAQLGIWLSPWGGYATPLEKRVSHAAELGYTLIDGKFALSDPVYYKSFHEKVMSFIKDQGITFFKLDGTGDADTTTAGSEFTSNFDAALHLITDARQANKDVFINLTSGTTASPAWLFFADSIWRGGIDTNYYGPGTASAVQQWMTYRDLETYRSIVKKGPLFPLNSLMLHGVVYAKQAGDLSKQSPKDFSDQAWSYFATGTQLQEMYITPDLLTPENWDILAKAVLWTRQNKEVMFDSHWVGGDPSNLDVYGWAGWSHTKSIITLRNPSPDISQSFFLKPGAQLEVPKGQPSRFNVQLVYGKNTTVPTTIRDGVQITLAPLELITLELTPTN